MKIKLASSLIAIVLISLIVGACTTAAAEPTIDPNVIYTEAAKTVSAQLTMDAPPTQEPSPTALPTNTPVPATNTPVPERATETPAPTKESAETSTEAATPTIKANSNANELIDEALFIYFFPPDDQRYTPGGVFDAQVGFRNTGPNTWNGGYSMRYLSGPDFGVGGKYTIDSYGTASSVAPGEEVIITIPGMTAPDEVGTYMSNWCFYNNREDQGLAPQCFFLVTFQIVVGYE